MGVDIGSLFTKETIQIKDLQNRVIAIDAHNVLHQFLSSIRQRDGTPLMDANGHITSHLNGLLHRTSIMIEKKVKPIYVFDGPPHPLKQKTLEMRKKRKILAEKQWKEALEKGDLVTARSKAQQTSRVTDEIINQSKELLTLLGIPFIQAPSEGEAQASYLVKNGDAYAIGSQDLDCLLLGSPFLIRNLTSSSRRKLPGKKAYVSVYPERIQLNSNLDRMGINQKQLVDMAILIGTDFNDGIKGIGPKKSLNLIKKNGNVENVLSVIGGDEVPTFDEINQIRHHFLHPEIFKEYSIRWNPIDKKGVIDYLCGMFQFSENRVKPSLEKFSIMDDIAKQQTLF